MLLHNYTRLLMQLLGCNYTPLHSTNDVFSKLLDFFKFNYECKYYYFKLAVMLVFFIGYFTKNLYLYTFF